MLGVAGSRCSVVLEKKKEKSKAYAGLGTSICPLPLYVRQPPAQHQAGKMEDKLGGPKKRNKRQNLLMGPEMFTIAYIRHLNSPEHFF